MSIVINGTGSISGISVGGLPDGTVDAGTLATDSVSLTEMASGTDGNIISYDASGNPVAIATGSDGQVLTSTGAGSPPAFEALAAGGKVLQIVTSVSTTASYPTTSFTSIASGTIAITPSATSSKILYIYNSGGMISGETNGCALRLQRGGTTVRQSTRYGYNNTGTWSPFPITYIYLDDPSSTSAVTYTLDGQEQASAGWEVNDTGGTNSAFVMAIEIGA